MNTRYCYWSVVAGDNVDRMQRMIESARRVGVFKDFHVWSEQPVRGAVHHAGKLLKKGNPLFKMHLLRAEVKKLNCDYFIWLDSESWFVRNPGDPLLLMHGSPVHSSLESDVCDPGNQRSDWGGCSLKNYATLMRFKGVRSKAIFIVNSGFWIVHREVIDRFCELALDFWDFSKQAGFVFKDDAPLAYATQMLCGNPYLHTLRETSDLWASGWAGDAHLPCPDGNPWPHLDPLSLATFDVNPAIVRTIRRKGARVNSSAGPAPSRSGSKE